MDELTKKTEAKVLEELKNQIAQQKARYELTRKALGVLQKYEGRQITKRLEAPLQEAFAPVRCGIEEHYGTFTLYFYGDYPNYGRTNEINIGVKANETRTTWKTPGRINVQDIAERHQTTLDFPKRLQTYQQIIPQIPGLVEKWNKAVDALMEVKEAVKDVHPLCNGVFARPYIREKED